MSIYPTLRLVSILSTFALLSCASSNISSNDSIKSEYSLNPLAQALIKSAYQDNTAYEVTESLTMEIGPRLAGSDGDKDSIVWGINKLKELGFENVHTQNVEVPHWVRGDISVEISSPFKQKLVATALGGSIGTSLAGIEAQVLMTDTVETLNALTDSGQWKNCIF